MLGEFFFRVRFKMRHFVVCTGKAPHHPKAALNLPATPTSCAPNLTKRKFYEFCTKQQSFLCPFVAFSWQWFSFFIYTYISVCVCVSFASFVKITAVCIMLKEAATGKWKMENCQPEIFIKICSKNFLTFLATSLGGKRKKKGARKTKMNITENSRFTGLPLILNFNIKFVGVFLCGLLYNLYLCYLSLLLFSFCLLLFYFFRNL